MVFMAVESSKFTQSSTMKFRPHSPKITYVIKLGLPADHPMMVSLKNNSIPRIKNPVFTIGTTMPETIIATMSENYSINL